MPLTGRAGEIAGALDKEVRAWVLQGFEPAYGKRAADFAADARWQAVRAAGTELWLDTGDMQGIQKQWTREFSALTTNNTLLNKEVQRGQYDDLVRRTAAKLRQLSPGITADELVLEIAFVLNAYHGLRLVEKFDAYVSVEEHTDLADEVDLAVLYGRRFFAICPQRFFVKLPLTPAGLLGMRKLGQAGVPVNFTLGFSARHNYLAARFGNPAYVNVFLGRLNSFVADSKLGTGDGVGEKATMASQEAVAALRKEANTRTKQIAASMRNGEQVWSLAGVDVMTIPLAAAAEYHDSTQPPVAGRGTASEKIIPGVDARALQALHFEHLWDVPPALRNAVDRLLREDLDRMTPAQLVAFMRREGFTDLFPEYTPEDLEAIRAHGKIPKLDDWRARIEAGKAGIDALFNTSGLQSFGLDQKALDDRVRGLLG
jgi:transaldolase